MLLDSHQNLNDFQHLNEARKRSPKNKSIKSLLRSYDKFTDYISNNSSSQKKVTFLSSPEKDSNYSKKRSKSFNIETDSGIGLFDSPPSKNANDTTYFDEEPTLIIAVVRMISGNVVKCLKVKLMVNLQQFQDLRTDPKRLKVFKKKLQPLMLELLPAEDKFKSWTIDCIEPCDDKLSSEKSSANCGSPITKEKLLTKETHCAYTTNYFDAFNGEDAMNYPATSSPCQSETFCDSVKSLDSEENSISEVENINCQPTEDNSFQHKPILPHSSVDIPCNKIKEEYGTATSPNSVFSKSKISERANVCSDQDLFDLLYNYDSKLNECNENFVVKNEKYVKTDQNVFPIGWPNHFSDKEIFQVGVSNKSSAVLQDNKSKFNLNDLLEKWDEESQFVKGTKSAEDLNQTMVFDSDSYEHNNGPNTNSETGSVSSDNNNRTSTFNSVSSKSQSNIPVIKNEISHLESIPDDESNIISNVAFQVDLMKDSDDVIYTKEIYKKNGNNFNFPQKDECLNHIHKFNDVHCQSQSRVENSSFLTESSDDGHNLIGESEQLCSSMSDMNDVNSEMSVLNTKPTANSSKFSSLTSSPTMPFQRLRSPLLSSQLQNCSLSDQLGSITNHTLEPVIHSSSSPRISKEPTDGLETLTPYSLPKLESTAVHSVIQDSTLTFEPLNQSYISLGDDPANTQNISAYQREPLKIEINLQQPSFPRDNDEPLLISKNVSLVKETKVFEDRCSFSNTDEKNVFSHSSSDQSLNTPLSNPKPTHFAFNRKPTCSLLISNRFKSLSKNKSESALATGRPVPQRKQIPFLMSSRLKSISKNKSTSLLATGRPIPKRKEIPFLMKGKLKKT